MWVAHYQFTKKKKKRRSRRIKTPCANSEDLPDARPFQQMPSGAPKTIINSTVSRLMSVQNTNSEHSACLLLSAGLMGFGKLEAILHSNQETKSTVSYENKNIHAPPCMLCCAFGSRPWKSFFSPWRLCIASFCSPRLLVKK